MEFADRVTLIHSDGRTSRHERVQVVSDDPRVIIDASTVPKWAEASADVVAARDDGSVIVAFTISSVDDVYGNSERNPGNHYYALRG